ncbi:MAG: hypothetical protein ACRDXX_09270 [Stackebrandtia sp.]
MRSRAIVAAVAVLFIATAAFGGRADAAEGFDSAVCETHDVQVVKGHDVEVRAEPDLNAPRLFTAEGGDFYRCSAVTVGGVHSECDADESEVWLVITDFARFDVYAPSSCLVDIWFDG